MGIRIDALNAASSAAEDHELPAMKDGLTVKLTVSQISTLITALITDSAPATLDTLNELAAALGDDPNFATTVTNALALKADVSALVTKQDAAPLAFGQCRLALSGGNLILSRFNGRLLTINGVHQVIPSTAPTLSATSLTPSTLYYIYAWMNSGVMTLEASTTAYAVDSTTGVAIKSGDATRTLVGMARPVTGPAWANTAGQRLVRSWFNDPGITTFNALTNERSTSSTTFIELNTEIRCEFLLWSGEVADAYLSAMVTNGTSSGRNNTAIAFDGTTAESGGTTIISAATTVFSQSASAYRSNLSEGYHYATMVASVDAGTGTWYGSLAAQRTTLKVRISRS